MKHTTSIKVRFRDIDQFGHVNNAVYLSYFEEARIRYLDDLLGEDIDWSEKGVILARTEINYIRPVRMKDTLEVETHCVRIGSKSFDLEYKIFRMDGAQKTEVASGMTVLVCFDYTAGKTIEVLSEWKEKLETHEDTPDSK